MNDNLSTCQLLTLHYLLLALGNLLGKSSVKPFDKLNDYILLLFLLN